nr:glycosyltransferase family 39 protein [Lachnospiraceae bacterium]
MKKRTKYIYPVCFAALVALIAFLAFYKLDVKYVDPWDEARHGVNAYEMANGGSLFQNTYLRQADYYNLKPPLSMWCIMLGMAIFGNGVFALRFYSALCYVVLAISAGLCLRRYGKLESLLAMAFLAVNTTAFQAHMIRAGDADSLFVLLFTLAMFCMMRIPEKKYNLYLCGLFFALAFLTKSYHAGIIAAIGGVYLILTGQIKKLGIRNWLLFLASILVPILLWAVPRAMVDGTTFFQKMWETDVLGRADGTLQNNIAPFTYYLEYFLGASSGKVTAYLCAFVICLLGVFLFSRSFTWKNRESYIGWMLWIFIPLLGFSLIQNKLLWYMYPVLVPLLLAAGVFAARILKSKEILPALRVLFGIAVAAVLVYYGNGVLETIDAQGPNEFQQLVRKVAQEEQYKGCQVFVDYDLMEDGSVNSVWSQQDVFVAQAYGDFECVEDGIMGLMLRSTYAGQEGILFVNEDVCEQYPTFYEGCELLEETEHYRAYVVTY